MGRFSVKIERPLEKVIKPILSLEGFSLIPSSFLFEKLIIPFHFRQRKTNIVSSIEFNAFVFLVKVNFQINPSTDMKCVGLSLDLL